MRDAVMQGRRRPPWHLKKAARAALALRTGGLGRPAVAFIPAGLIEAPQRDPDRGGISLLEPRLTWQQIIALSDAGVAIGSHAWTHRSLGSMSAAAVRREGERSRAALERCL